MIDADLLSILACPEDKSPVHLASPEVVTQVNEGIRQGKVKNRAGQVVSEEISEGLIRADGKYLYPVREDIPVMLIDEAIVL